MDSYFYKQLKPEKFKLINYKIKKMYKNQVTLLKLDYK